MNVDRFVLGFAGNIVLAGMALAHFVAPGWIWLSRCSWAPTCCMQQLHRLLPAGHAVAQAGPEARLR
ncbi:hypothetical protein [Rhodanobacter lindaniclasticus]